jgi:hypothetical protein
VLAGEIVEVGIGIEIKPAAWRRKAADVKLETKGGDPAGSDPRRNS